MKNKILRTKENIGCNVERGRMKVKELIKELSNYDDEDDVLAYFYDEETDFDFECDFKVDGDVVPLLILEEIRRY